MTGKVKLVSAGGGSVSLATPSTGSNRTVTLPDADVTIGATNSAGVLTTQGDTLYRDGSGIQRLAKGTASQVLTMNSGATAPEWAAAGGGLLLKKTYYQIGRGTFTSDDFPNDDTVPQITEGVEIFSQAYTPTNTSGCEIWVTTHFHLAETSNVANSSIAALFISGTDDALQVRSNYSAGDDGTRHNADFTIIHKLATWSGAKTFSIRVAGSNSYNYGHYGVGYAEAKYGSAACFSPFIIEEVST